MEVINVMHCQILTTTTYGRMGKILKKSYGNNKSKKSSITKDEET